MPAKHIYEFGEFRIDPEERLLIRDGNPIPLTPKAFETLLALVENSGRVVKKDDLMNRVWPDAFVEEVNLAQNVSAIRRVLDTSGEQYIETVPKLGYRLIVKAKVIGEPEEGTDPSPASPMAAAAESASAAASPKKPRIKRRVTVVGLTAVLVAIGVTWRLKTHVAKDAPVHISSLAVLPLENLSRDPDQEYFADGMTDELITDLAKIHALRVISRNSVMQYKGKHKPAPQIARELNVDAVVEGTVMRSGDRVRITAQLIAAPQDQHLWAETYEGELRNVLALQDEVTAAIAKEISIQLTPDEQTQFAHARSVDPEGHQAYLRGLHELSGHTSEGNAKAIEHFQRAIAIDGNDALAYEGLALAYISSPDRAPKTVMPKARSAALKAIELDDSLAEAHSSLGLIKLVFDWDWPGAEKELRRAVELNPNSPLAHVDYGRYLLLVPQRVNDAIQNYRRAYDLDPAVPAEHDDLVGFLFFARAYQGAIDEAAREFEDNSPFLALAYAKLGRRNEALAIADRAAASARVPSQVAQTASAYALAGDKQRAHELLRKLVAQANQRYLCGMNVAAIYSVLGEKDDAIRWLEKGYRDRSI